MFLPQAFNHIDVPEPQEQFQTWHNQRHLWHPGIYQGSNFLDNQLNVFVLSAFICVS